MGSRGSGNPCNDTQNRVGKTRFGGRRRSQNFSQPQKALAELGALPLCSVAVKIFISLGCDCEPPELCGAGWTAPMSEQRSLLEAQALHCTQEGEAPTLEAAQESGHEAVG